jgi:hypothetical protein
VVAAGKVAIRRLLGLLLVISILKIVLLSYSLHLIGTIQSFGARQVIIRPINHAIDFAEY